MSSNTPRLDQVERNLLINGNMDFWQRGTSFSASNAYTADRWILSLSGYTSTVTQSTDVPTQAQSGFQSRYSLLATNGTGASPTAGQFHLYGYKMEGQDYQNIHSRKVRFQFWTKSSVAGTFPISFQNSSATRSYVTTYTVTNANTWQKIVIDLALDTTGTWSFDNTAGLIVYFAPTAGSTFQTSTLNAWQAGNFIGATGQTQWGATTSATFQLAQVMLIPQDFTQAGTTTVDVPFQRAGRSIGHELQMCQRYYRKSYEVTTNPQTATLVGAWGQPSTTAWGSTVRWSVPRYGNSMRAAPTVTTYSFNGTVNAAFGFNSTGTDITNGAQVSGTTGTESFVVTNQSGSQFPADATQMYMFHWQADAEL